MTKSKSLRSLVAVAAGIFPAAASARPGVSPHPRTITARTQTIPARVAHEQRARIKTPPPHRLK